jgi:hypothetical protein
MASESVGGVSYNVDVDYGDLNALEGAVDKTTKEITKDFNNADKSIKGSTTGIKASVSKTAVGVNSAIKGMGKETISTGILFQDLASKVSGAGGQFVGMAQTASQLGFVLGGPLLAAVASVAAIIGGSVVSASKDGTAAIVDLISRLKELKEESGLSAVQAQALSEKEKDGLEEKYKAIKALEDEIRANEQLIKVRSAAGTAGDKSAYAIPRSADENQKKFAKNLEASRRIIIDNKAEIGLLNTEIEISKDKIKEYEEGASEAGKKQRAIRDTVSEINRQSAITTEQLLKCDNAARRLAMALSLGLTNAEMLPPELMKSLAILEKAEEQAKAEHDFRQQAAADQAEAIRDIENERNASHQAELKRIAEEKAAKAKQDSIDAGLIKTLGVSQEVQIKQNTLDQLAELDRLYREGDLAGLQDYTNRKLLIEKQGQDSLDALKKGAEGIDWRSFGNQATGALAGVAVGAQSGTDAIRGLAISIAQEAIGALIKLAIQSQAIKASETAAGVAQAGTLTAAYAPAAAAASIATGGGAAISGTTLALGAIGAISAALIGGGRLYGGPVQSGKMYPITENGKPEILQQGSKQYLLPGSGGGNVISNADMQSGNGSGYNIKVEVNNYGGDQVKVERGQTQGANAQEVIRIVVGDINNRGGIHKAMTQTTTAGNRT